MSETPRTDEQINGKPCTRFEILAGDSLRNAAVPSEFARTIERELNAAHERIKRLEDNIEKLKDAGDLVFIWLLYNRSHIGGLDVDSALREWKQSKKEAKP